MLEISIKTDIYLNYQKSVSVTKVCFNMSVLIIEPHLCYKLLRAFRCTVKLFKRNQNMSVHCYYKRTFIPCFG